MRGVKVGGLKVGEWVGCLWVDGGWLFYNVRTWYSFLLVYCGPAGDFDLLTGAASVPLL